MSGCHFVFLRWHPDEFEKYCSDVEHTAAWGGQLEVGASGVLVLAFLTPSALTACPCLWFLFSCEL